MSWDLVEVLKWIRHEESNCVNNGIKHCFLCDTQPGVRKKITRYIRGSGYLGIMFNLIISRLLIGDYSLKSSAWRRTHFSPLRTLLLHPILPLQGLSMSWRGIWKFADSKAFLQAVCSAFKLTLILCPPAENWLLEKAGSPCAELSKLSVKELCLFSCLRQVFVEEGKSFSLPLADEVKGVQVEWPLLWIFFRTTSLAFFDRILVLSEY